MQEVVEGYRLSPQQERVWSLAGGEPRAAYRAGCVVLVEGALEAARLEAALRETVARHEILRTRFECLPGMTVPLQVVAEPGEVAVERHDPPRGGADIETLIQEMRRAGRGAEDDAALRARLVRVADDKHLLLLTLPALCADSRTLTNLVGEIARGYERRAAGEEREEAEAPPQYADLAEVFNELLESEETTAGRDYWNGRRLGLPAVVLPYEKEAGGEARFEPRAEVLGLDEGVVERLKALGEECGGGVSAVLLACWQALVARLSQQREVVTGAACGGRTYEGLDEALGLFAKFVPVGLRLEEGDAFLEAARRTGVELREAAKWQEYFTWRGLAGVGGEAAAAPFFHVCYEYEERDAGFTSGALSFTILRRFADTDRFKLKLVCALEGARLRAELHYDAAVFDAAAAARLAGQYGTLLGSALANPRAAVGSLELLSEAERRRLLYELNETDAAFPLDLCAHQLVERQAKLTPETTAVLCEGRRLSYAELNARANQLARRLLRLGVGPDELVGLCVERSPEMVVGLLGILKAGAAYLPLDPAYPKERLEYMLADARVRVVLTDERLSREVPRQDCRLVRLDADWNDIAREGQEDLQTSSAPDNLAYVIYTSGSTGTPKGVAVTHRGLVNYLCWAAERYRVSEGCGTLVHSPVGFDLTVTSLFTPLVVGRAVTLLPEGETVEALSRALLSGRDFSLLKITPAHLDVLSQLLPADEAAGRARVLVIGGEALHAESLRFWRRHAPATRLVNEYGPTETVVGCCVYEVHGGDPEAGDVPIGRPVANTQLFILDALLRPVPAGASGELCIAGAGLARGYLGRAGVTAERFVPNPYAGNPGARMYRTGDLARYLPDGRIEFIGRNDGQVKIRGYRVELGEIEAALRSHPSTEEALVVARAAGAEVKRLVAYVVPREGQKLSVGELRGHLRGRLPEYMVPAAFVTMKALPLTANGKVDRNALPDPEGERPELDEPYVRPRDEAERFIAGIWQDVLKVNRVGVNDNFFDLGGHSLLVFQVHTKLRQRFPKDLTVVELFRYTTIGALAKHLSEAREAGDEDAARKLQERVARQKEALRRHRQTTDRRKKTDE